MDGILSVNNHGINEHMDNKSSIEIAQDYKAMGVVSVYRLPVEMMVVVSVDQWT